ncbi:MAG: adenosine-specific kinase [Candidatus Methanoperedens sp.]|nr:adenosine-specific kinase [Candidatus Methanoperedens sp.]MCZ7403509.1 adenosine-specific kinase [Candidatus Methanoperedens sp.]
MEIKSVKITAPRDTNLILGQTHFIKSAEDLYETLITGAPGIKFGLAFSEASGKCLVRSDGNDDELVKAAEENALALGCGHSFIIFMRNAYPINVLNAIKNVQEVCNIFCATANPVEVIVAETGQGRGILGVVDGESPKGIESPKDKEERKTFLRSIGYKR